jgi:hypothetical protein
VGFTTIGKNRDDDVAPDVGEIRTFFVRPTPGDAASEAR